MHSYIEYISTGKAYPKYSEDLLEIPSMWRDFVREMRQKYDFDMGRYRFEQLENPRSLIQM